VKAVLEVDKSVEHVRMTANDGGTALMCASTGVNVDSVKAILEADPSVEHVRMANNMGGTALMCASGMGNVDSVKAILEADPSIEHICMAANNGNTALSVAANDEIKALLRAAEAAADVKVVDDGRCAQCGEAADMSCSTCKSVSYCSEKHQRQHWKASHKRVCKSLAASLAGDGKADEVNDSDDETAALVTLCNRSDATAKEVRALVASGVDVNEKDSAGVSALGAAIDRQNIEVVQELIRAGAQRSVQQCFSGFKCATRYSLVVTLMTHANDPNVPREATHLWQR
jgi:ankyrin repeat protein